MRTGSVSSNTRCSPTGADALREQGLTTHQLYTQERQTDSHRSQKTQPKHDRLVERDFGPQVLLELPPLSAGSFPSS